MENDWLSDDIDVANEEYVNDLTLDIINEIRRHFELDEQKSASLFDGIAGVLTNHFEEQ